MHAKILEEEEVKKHLYKKICCDVKDYKPLSLFPCFVCHQSPSFVLVLAERQGRDVTEARADSDGGGPSRDGGDVRGGGQTAQEEPTAAVDQARGAAENTRETRQQSHHSSTQRNPTVHRLLLSQYYSVHSHNMS